MSYSERERIEESIRGTLDTKPWDYMNDEAMIEFVIYLSDNLHPDQFKSWVDAWVRTSDGQKWRDKTLEELYSDAAEEERDPLGGDREDD